MDHASQAMLITCNGRQVGRARGEDDQFMRTMSLITMRRSSARCAHRGNRKVGVEAETAKVHAPTARSKTVPNGSRVVEIEQAGARTVVVVLVRSRVRKQQPVRLADLALMG
jgi:hypothetical protein